MKRQPNNIALAPDLALRLRIAAVQLGLRYSTLAEKIISGETTLVDAELKGAANEWARRSHFKASAQSRIAVLNAKKAADSATPEATKRG